MTQGPGYVVQQYVSAPEDERRLDDGVGRPEFAEVLFRHRLAPVVGEVRVGGCVGDAYMYDTANSGPLCCGEEDLQILGGPLVRDIPVGHAYPVGVEERVGPNQAAGEQVGIVEVVGHHPDLTLEGISTVRVSCEGPEPVALP